MVDKRVEFEQYGWMLLGKKRDVEAKDAPFAPLKIFQCTEDGKPDYAGSSLLITRKNLADLLEGREYKVPVVISPPFVPTAKVDNGKKAK